jgi:CDP-diacylglycerol--serine O-phosphatidyltransferase
LAWLVTVYAGLSMVSNAPFYSFKDFDLKRSVPFVFVLGLVLVFALVSTDPPLILFLLFMVYGCSGYVIWLWRWQRRRSAPGDSPPPAAPPPPASPS